MLAAPTLSESTSYGLETGTRDDFETDETFYGVKVDYYINDNNVLEITHFSDEGQTVNDSYQWDADTETTGTYLGPSFTDFGGSNTIISLSSILTENLTFDISYGENEYDRTSSSSTANLPPIYDNRDECLSLIHI